MQSRFKISGTCGGACCRMFHLPYSKEELIEYGKSGRIFNNDPQECGKIVDMVVPLGHGMFKDKMQGHYKESFEKTRNQNDDRELHYFTCRHLNQKTSLCDNYEKRPAVCKLHPTETFNSWINDGKYHKCESDHICPYRDCKLKITEHPLDKIIRLILYGVNGKPPEVVEYRSLRSWGRLPMKDRIRWWLERNVFHRNRFVKKAQNLEEFL